MELHLISRYILMNTLKHFLTIIRPEIQSGKIACNKIDGTPL